MKQSHEVVDAFVAWDVTIEMSPRSRAAPPLTESTGRRVSTVDRCSFSWTIPRPGLANMANAVQVSRVIGLHGWIFTEAFQLKALC